MTDSWIDWATTSMLLAARLAPVVIWLPSVVLQGLPRGARLGLVVIVAACLAWLEPKTGALVPEMSVAFAAALIRELTLGLSLTLGCVLLFAGLQVSGGLLGPLVPQGLASAINPWDGEPCGHPDSIFRWLSVAVFWITGMHRRMVGAWLDSLETLPLGGDSLVLSPTEFLGQMLQTGTVAGIQLAMPVALTLFLAHVVTSLLTRAWPSLATWGLQSWVPWAVLLVMICALLTPLVGTTERLWLDLIGAWRATSISPVPLHGP